MNVPGIRAALERVREENPHSDFDPVVRVGLRACDDVGVSCCGECGPCVNQEPCAVVAERVEVIADILREAGVEVEK